jgi:hypothetical protein
VIRLFRRAHYGFYREASGLWYLGYFDCPGGACAQMQPVAGPFRAYSASASGVRFAYFDSTGAATTNRNLVARVDVTLRTETTLPDRTPGLRGPTYQDSLNVVVALRNRS